MSSTIKNLYEITNHLYKDRRLSYSSIIGIGPDDLIAIDKQEKAFLQNPTLIPSYHQICGFEYNENSFSKYFEELVSRQEKGSYLPFTKSYVIIKGRAYTYNSFVKSDMCITAIPGEPTSTIQFVNSDLKDKAITDEVWKQIKICTSLRFYRASQPILYSLFGTRPTQSSALRVFHLENHLSYDDFCYIIDNHTITDELIASVASGILISLDISEISSFLSNYILRIPIIFSHILHLIGPMNELFTSLNPLFQKHIQLFSDDFDVIFPLLQYLLNKEKIDECNEFMPILINSFWSTPFCGIYLAKLAMQQNDTLKAITFMNAACFSKSWPASTVGMRNYSQTQNLKYNNPLVESKMIKSPFVGANAEFFKTVYQIIQKDDFQNKWDEFRDPVSFAKREKDKKNSTSKNNRKNSEKIQIKINSDNSSFSLLQKASKTMKNFATNKQIYVNWPKPNFEVIENKNDEIYLNDPGIDFVPPMPKFEIFNDFPISPFFHDVIKETTSLLNKRNELLSKEVLNDKAMDIYSILLLALRVDDEALFFKCYNYLYSNGANGIEKILLIYAKINGYGIDLEELLQLEIKNSTQTENNAIIYLECLASAFERLKESAK